MKKDLQLLDKIYKGTHIGSKSLNSMLPSIKNNSMRRAVISQISEYDKINSDARMLITSMGETARKPVLTSVSATVEAKLSVASDSSPSHIAETIIKGSNMGIITITKELNKSRLCTPTVYDLGRRLVKTEENNVERIKAFL